MSVFNCDECRERDGVITRYKKDRDEALLIADNLRSRIRSVTDATTHHDRVEQEMFSRLAKSQHEVASLQAANDDARKSLEAERIKTAHATAQVAEAIETARHDMNERVRFEALAKKHELAAGDLRFKLHEVEVLPLVRRVWPESRLERIQARLIVEAGPVLWFVARTAFYFTLGVLAARAALRVWL